MLSLLQFLIVENQQKLSEAIRRLESFPNLPEFRELRSVQHKLKYSGGSFTLRQVTETPGLCASFSFFPAPVPKSHHLGFVPSSFLQDISHFLSVDSCDSLPLTRLEGVKELSRQLHDNKGQIRELLKESHGNVTLNQRQWLLIDVLISQNATSPDMR